MSPEKYFFETIDLQNFIAKFHLHNYSDKNKRNHMQEEFS